MSSKNNTKHFAIKHRIWSEEFSCYHFAGLGCLYHVGSSHGSPPLGITKLHLWYRDAILLPFSCEVCSVSLQVDFWGLRDLIAIQFISFSSRTPLLFQLVSGFNTLTCCIDVAALSFPLRKPRFFPSKPEPVLRVP